MHIKRSTKLQYELLNLPEGAFTQELADELTLICQTCRKEGRSVIIDASDVTSSDVGVMDRIAQWQADAYEENTSWVMACLDKTMWPAEDDFPLNLTPTLDEAIDIVAMEIIERELLGDDF